MKKKLFLLNALAAVLVCGTGRAQSLAEGGQFKDRLLPMQGNVMSSETWGAAASKPRLVDNGIEDDTYSYWGGNIVLDDNGKYHIHVSGWPESSAKGHATWSSGSMVYHAVSDNPWGPYVNVATIGKGHNSETYRARDGRYVTYIINGRYISESLDGPWEFGNFNFDQRQRPLLRGTDTSVSLSNMSFTRRHDGSFLAIDRGGSIWVSVDGVEEYRQITDATVYTGNAGAKEDPVLWRDSLQYHMIVNDYNARIAYYSRSLDGIHWTTEPGRAYDTSISRHEDGSMEEWYKFERPKIFQDTEGRAAYMNFAVIDTVKSADKANDNHSSKNIVLPLNPGMLMEVLGTEAVTASTASIQVRIKATGDFCPATDVNVQSLRFGVSSLVVYGKGAAATASETDGRDLIVTFPGADTGIAPAEFAPMMLGRDNKGAMIYGYAKMPAVNYTPAILSAMRPAVGADNKAASVIVENFGLSSSAETTVKVSTQSGTLIAEGKGEPIAPYGKTTVILTPKTIVPAGTTSLVVTFHENGKEIERCRLTTKEITDRQEELKELINTANSLLADGSKSNGREEMSQTLAEAIAAQNNYCETVLDDCISKMRTAIKRFRAANNEVQESYDFYTWALMDGATIGMTDDYVQVNGVNVPVADEMRCGNYVVKFNGRLAFNHGVSNFDLRNKGEGDASTGLFDFNKDSYFCVLNLNPGDKVTLNITGEEAFFASDNALPETAGATGKTVAVGEKVISGTTYVMTGEEGTKVRLDIKGVHYTTIKKVTLITSDKESISAPQICVTGARYGQRTVTIIPGVGSAQTEAEATFYTLDGTQPTPESPLYDAPFSIESTTTVKAISTLYDGSVSDETTTVVEAGTTLGLNNPSFSISGMEETLGNHLSPVVTAQFDNSSVIGNPEVSLYCTFNGNAVSLPYTFEESGTLTAILTAEGYDDASASVTLAGKYTEDRSIDYAGITAAEVVPILGTSWSVGTEPTRWAYWNSAYEYYVATSSNATDPQALGDFVLCDGGVSLLMDCGMGKNTLNGTTKYRTKNIADESIICYAVNDSYTKTRDFTPYYIYDSQSSYAFNLVGNHTLAQVSVYVPDRSGEDAITRIDAERDTSGYLYDAHGRLVKHFSFSHQAKERLPKGMYIDNNGRKFIVK